MASCISVRVSIGDRKGIVALAANKTPKSRKSAKRGKAQKSQSHRRKPQERSVGKSQVAKSHSKGDEHTGSAVRGEGKEL